MAHLDNPYSNAWRAVNLIYLNYLTLSVHVDSYSTGAGIYGSKGTKSEVKAQGQDLFTLP